MKNLNECERKRKTIIEQEDCSFWIVENFTQDYFDVFNKLELEIKPPIKIFGRECHQQRDVGFYSDESSGYTYSNQQGKTFPLTEELRTIMKEVNEYLGTSFNGILINKYNNGNEYLSSHSDSEKGLDKNSIVAGISYGATRNFRIRDKYTKSIVKNYYHKSCTLIVMDGNFQNTYKHEIPIEKDVKKPRISLTFRRHIK